MHLWFWSLPGNGAWFWHQQVFLWRQRGHRDAVESGGLGSGPVGLRPLCSNLRMNIVEDERRKREELEKRRNAREPPSQVEGLKLRFYLEPLSR